MFDNNNSRWYSDDEIRQITAMTVDILTAKWGTEVRVEFNNRLKRRCYCTPVRNGRSNLVFGIDTLRGMMKDGDIWNPRLGINLRGLNMVVSCACHEYAHAVMFDIDWNNTKLDWHAGQWRKFYLDMLHDMQEILK